MFVFVGFDFVLEIAPRALLIIIILNFEMVPPESLSSPGWAGTVALRPQLPIVLRLYMYATTLDYRGDSDQFAHPSADHCLGQAPSLPGQTTAVASSLSVSCIFAPSAL